MEKDKTKNIDFETETESGFETGSEAVKLTYKQEMFCREFITDFNGTQAAIRAGYSEKTAFNIASENLKKPDIQFFLKELLIGKLEKFEITSDKVLNEVSKIAFSDITKLLKQFKGNVLTFKNLDEMPGDLKDCISSIQPTAHGVKITMHNKLDALDKLMRHLGLFAVDNSQKKEDKPVQLYILPDGTKIEF